MKTIIILDACIVAGAHAPVGARLQVSSAEAVIVVGIGRARFATDADAAPVEIEAAVVAPEEEPEQAVAKASRKPRTKKADSVA